MRSRNKPKTIVDFCSEINAIIENKSSIKVDYYALMFDFEAALNLDFNFNQFNQLCDTTLIIAKTKNKVIRYIEKDIWQKFTELPFHVISNYDFEIEEDEVLNQTMDYDNEAKNMLSRLLKLAIDTLNLRDDKSKANEIRRAGALKIIGELVEYYIIPGSKALFMNSMNSNNKKEQYCALIGLEHYYATPEDKIDSELVENLNKIFDETDDRSVASTCLQIKINAGLINEITASFAIADWKDEH